MISIGTLDDVRRREASETGGAMVLVKLKINDATCHGFETMGESSKTL